MDLYILWPEIRVVAWVPSSLPSLLASTLTWMPSICRAHQVPMVNSVWLCETQHVFFLASQSWGTSGVSRTTGSWGRSVVCRSGLLIALCHPTQDCAIPVQAFSLSFQELDLLSRPFLWALSIVVSAASKGPTTYEVKEGIPFGTCIFLLPK